MLKKRMLHKTRALLLSILFVLPVVGVQAADRAELASRYYEDALARMEREDIKGAIVQLKNALQQDSKMLSALVLLGEAYVKAGDPRSAERVLADAEKLGAARSEIIGLQVEVHGLLGKSKELLERFSAEGLPPGIQYKVLLARAYALMDLDRAAEALRLVEQARQIEPGNHSAMVAQSLAYLRLNRLAEAKTMANMAIGKNSSDPAAWNMKASVAHAQDNLAEALEGYGKALKLKPEYLDVLIARASLLLDMKRDQDAGKDIAILKQKFPDDPRSAYLQALLAGRQGDEAAARQALIKASTTLDTLPFDAVVARPQLLLIGGMAHFSLGQNQKAKTYLGRYLDKFPRHLGARKVVMAMMLGEKDYARAIAFMEGPGRTRPDDPQALSMLATAYMAVGQHSKAVALLTQAAEMTAGKVPDISATYGLSLIGAGEKGKGVAQLKSAYAKAPGFGHAGVPLAIMYLREDQVKPALQVLQEVVKKEPENLTALNLLGIARGISGDLAAARKTYEQVLAKDKSVTSAKLNLARLDLFENKPDAARRRLAEILNEQPRNLDAHFEMAQVEIYSGKLQEAVRWLEKARSYNPRSLRPGLMLVDTYLKAGDSKKALDVAKELQASNRDDLSAMTALGQAYLAAGNQALARENFRRLAQLAGFDSGWQLRAAQMQLAARDHEGARYTLDKLLLGKPGHLPTLLLKSRLELVSGNLDVAETQLRGLAAQYPREAGVQQLIGDVAMQRRRYDDAINAYRQAYNLDKNAVHAANVYRAYSQSGNRSQALAFAQSWAKSRPSDLAAQHLVAEAYLASDRLQEARKAYEALLAQESRDPVALNNLANILLKLGDGGARTMADRAYKAAPHDPNVADTLGVALLKSGQPKLALKYLREARLRAPNNPNIREHLIEALQAAGLAREVQQERAAAQTLRADK